MTDFVPGGCFSPPKAARVAESKVKEICNRVGPQCTLQLNLFLLLQISLKSEDEEVPKLWLRYFGEDSQVLQ